MNSLEPPRGHDHNRRSAHGLPRDVLVIAAIGIAIAMLIGSLGEWDAAATITTAVLTALLLRRRPGDHED
ncbi:hypothetical protein [Nocardia asteroides]|uniref:hypothetical protein n=1 Tax=Nocardia asteroides TaxID=1824 RepID=UPI0033D76202